MLLFKKPFWQGLESGAITLTFRRWQKPHVRVGGRYRCHPIGVLEVDDVRLVPAKDITEEDARAAGFESREALVSYLAELGPLADDTPIWRVALHHGGDGDRVQIALDDRLTAEDVATIREKLRKMDAKKPWTSKTLAMIEAHPRVAASKLAVKLKRETLELKADIRKLKKLGLTQSFEVGYEIAPRGRAYLDATKKKKR
ncbi:MAG TPA: ASCH domain-containing protein [Labilithrix sp.]